MYSTWVIAEYNISAGKHSLNGNAYGPYSDRDKAVEQAKEWSEGTKRYGYKVVGVLYPDNYFAPGA
jgi:hypothetical protein